MHIYRRASWQPSGRRWYRLSPGLAWYDPEKTPRSYISLGRERGDWNICPCSELSGGCQGAEWQEGADGRNAKQGQEGAPAKGCQEQRQSSGIMPLPVCSVTRRRACNSQVQLLPSLAEANRLWLQDREKRRQRKSWEINQLRTLQQSGRKTKGKKILFMTIWEEETQWEAGVDQEGSRGRGWIWSSTRFTHMKMPHETRSWVAGEAQHYSPFLVCARPWVPSLVPYTKKSTFLGNINIC